MNKLKNTPFVLVLQHPREKKKTHTTADLIGDVLENIKVKSGLSWKNLTAAGAPPEAQPKNWVVLYMGAKKNISKNKKNRPNLYSFLDKKGEPMDQDPLPLSKIEGIILLDGTWKQSKTLWWRNAWLTRIPRLMLLPEKPSLYNQIKKEPRKECLSTLESLSLFLKLIHKNDSLSQPLLEHFEKSLLAPAPASPAPLNE